MNILFLTMIGIRTINKSGIYADLMRKFKSEGHCVTIITPRERMTGMKTRLVIEDGVQILGVKTLNLQKNNIIEKGVGQVLVERQFTKAYKKLLSEKKFDLIIYSTPPIIFPNTIEYIKKANSGAKTYLLLKDIFPQNAVDLGMLSKSGLKGILYKFFRRKEKKMYMLSDYIGCMSPANIKYVINNNPEVSKHKVELAPNCIELQEYPAFDRNAILSKFGLPINKPIFVYGGNLGKPQSIPYLIDCLKICDRRNVGHFVIVGDGTEYEKIKSWIQTSKPTNVSLFKRLLKEDYDQLVQVCNVGLICLDHRFSIPNYPSRLLTYLEHKIPVICATDVNTDIGIIAEENGYGYWCESVKPDDFVACVDKMLASDIKVMGEKGYQYLCENYLVDNIYSSIMKHLV